MNTFFLPGIAGGIFAAILIAIIIWQGNSRLTVSRYSVRNAKIHHSIRIAHLSDLHNKQFGKGNCRLAQVVSAQNPDLVVFTGDMQDRRQNYDKMTTDFLTGLAQKVPVIFVHGNQEMKGYFRNRLVKDLQKGGVTVLNNKAVNFTVSGQCISVLGLNDFWIDRRHKIAIQSGKRLLEQFQASGNFKLLLTHYPHFFNHYKKRYHYCDYQLDLVLAGHAHGGLIRLPILKGMFAPGQGLFPRYTAGLYRQKGVNMIVSRGLGNSGWPFRIFNPPEVVTIDILPK